MREFDADEAAAILKKAAATSHKELSSRKTGLTVQDLEAVAVESGIDPSHIHRAIDDIAGKSSTAKRSILGGPFSFHKQIEIDHEINATEWEEMLVKIRTFFRSKGEVAARESVYEWTSPKHTTNSAHVTAVKSDGKTRISLGWDGPLTALPFYLPLLLSLPASLLFGEGVLELTMAPGIIFTLMVMLSTFFAGRWALDRRMSTGFEKLDGLLDELQQMSSRDQHQHEPSIVVNSGGAEEKQDTVPASGQNQELLDLDSESRQEKESERSIQDLRGRTRS